MPNRLQNDVRTTIIFLLALLMPACLFFSRTALAFAMLAFAGACFSHPAIKTQLRRFFSSPVLWGMSLLFVIPFISGVWSADTLQWLEIMRTKLPLLFFPLAFAAPFGFTRKHWLWLALFFIALVTAGTVWSMIHYLGDTAGIHEGYLRSNSMITPLDNDHVRFSWMISVGLLLSGYIIYLEKNENKILVSALTVIALWLLVFLHILAARTGLFSFYICVMGIVARLLFKQQKWIYSLGLLLLLMLLPLLAYYTLPTFHNKVSYILYDADYIRNDQYLKYSNDGTRMISFKAGLGLISRAPLAGVGFGDIRDETHTWYAQHYPQLEEPEKIYPSSEYLFYGAGCGLPGLLVFMMVMILPFFTPMRHRLPWWMLHATIVAGFLFDIGLEIQFGVFLYTFIVLCWWKWPEAEKI